MTKTTTPPLRAILLPLLTVGALAAQEPPAAAAKAPAVPSVEELAARVDKAHCPSGKLPKVTAFHCNLELQMLDQAAEQGGDLGLAVWFMNWRKQGSKKVRNLIRYESRGGDVVLRRGIDRFGPWHLHRGEPTDLKGAEFEQDRASLVEHLNLARQLVRFVEPSKLITALRDPGEVQRERLRVTKAKQVDCLTVAGARDRFPMMQAAGDETPARIKVYVDAKTGLLIALDIWPITAGKVDDKRGERVLLSKFDDHAGALVPERLVYLWRNEAGELRARSLVNLITLELQPTFTVDTFDRR